MLGFSNDEVKMLVNDHLSRTTREAMERLQAGEDIKGLEGHGIWFAEDSSWTVKELEVGISRELADGHFRINTTCTMVRESARVQTPDRPPEQAKAEIVVTVRPGWEVTGLHLEWLMDI
jgi:hypothetical protein